mmetsp:Transcript_4043/g.12408  ORF Transcript_4043/g.12408 Transcript_4043/m.12408 type:complete len:234 (-) Transcript_4043:458-1159(-)
MGYDVSHTLFANSICPDEVNRKSPYWDGLLGGEAPGPGGKMSFSLGGLGGLPSVGKTGLKACASHVSSDSKRRCIFVLCASHAGVDRRGETNAVSRANQSGRSSTCCGAAVASLKWATSNVPFQADPDDAQMDECKLCVKAALDDLGDDASRLADVVSRAAFDKLCKLIPGNLNHACPVVVLSGIQLNTDDGLPDFFAPRSFVLFDAAADHFVDKSDLFATELAAALQPTPGG